MNKDLPTYPRILAIAPSSSGFGFALVEGVNTLADWGSRQLREDKNAGCIARIQKMLAVYEPQVLVLEDAEDNDLRRSERVQELTRQVQGLGQQSGLKVAVLRRRQVRQLFFVSGIGTKDGVAATLARWYPEELGRRLPPRRKAWMTEDHRMAMFDALALALAFRSKHIRRGP